MIAARSFTAFQSRRVIEDDRIIPHIQFDILLIHPGFAQDSGMVTEVSDKEGHAEELTATYAGVWVYSMSNRTIKDFTIESSYLLVF